MGLWRDKTRGDWCYKFMHQRRTYGGRGFATKGEARTAREERRKEVKSPKPETPTDTAFSVIANQYLDWSERRHVKKTYEYKRLVLKRFMAFLKADPDITEVTPRQVLDYLQTRPTKHNFNVNRKELSAFFAYSVKPLHVVVRSPLDEIEKLPENEPVKYVPPHKDIERVILAATPEQQNLLLVIVHTWARVNEILRLRWEHVNLEQRYVLLGTRKRKGGGMAYDPFPMNDSLYVILKAMWNDRKQDAWVFWNKKESAPYNRRPKMMKKLCERAGVKHFGFHALRHYVATYAKDKEKQPMGVISRLLRHKSLRTTEIYLHSMPGAVQEAVAKMDGIFVANPGGESGEKEG